MGLEKLIASPQSFLADLFLDKISSSSSVFDLNRSGGGTNEAFSQILNNTLKRTETDTYNNLTSDTGYLNTKPSEVVRKTALEEFQDQAEDLGVPLESISLQKEDLGRLEKVLKDSGLNDKEIEAVFEKISEGPLTMDRVLAAVSTVKSTARSGLTLSEQSLPMLGRFLQEVGFGPGAVKDILSSLKAGQKLGAEEFRALLVKNSDVNLKDLDFSNVDAGNLKDLLKSIGVKEGDLENFWSKIAGSKGKMSLEGLVSFLKSTDRPDPLSAQDMDNIRRLLENSMMSKGLKVNPQFDRIVTLLQSMGDQDINEKFMSENPAIQALRGGAMAAQKVTEGTGVVGDGIQKSETGVIRATGTDLKGQGGLAGGDSKSAETATASRGQQSGFSSRLSEQVAKQISDKMMYQVKNGRHQVRLNLVPAHLGRVSINMVVRDNTVHATVVAENPAVKEALEEHMTQLKSTLAQQGIDLERFDVDYGGRQRDADQSGRNRRRFSNSRQQKENDELNGEALNGDLENAGNQGLVNRLI